MFLFLDIAHLSDALLYLSNILIYDFLGPVAIKVCLSLSFKVR